MSVGLDRFSPASRRWFSGVFEAPTAAQIEAWESISTGQDTLVVAPTGSGKTLAAFLWAIDQIAAGGSDGNGSETDVDRGTTKRTGDSEGEIGVQVLYISPIKALGVDVERNLRAPLVGITEAAKSLGLAAPSITVGVRSGDTPPNERRRLIKHPPDILITTPESLYLLLTSNAAGTLRTVKTVIVDEIHALAPNKRGAHLALSLERLEILIGRPVQRIGLSATVRPIDDVARFLGGDRPVTIVAPQTTKEFDITVEVPVPDMTNPPLPDVAAGEAPGSGGEHRIGSMWPPIEHSVYRRIMSARSTIVFTNSRLLAERLTAHLNALHRAFVGASLGASPEAFSGIPRAEPEREDDHTLEKIARAHHGSVSKDVRKDVEEQLKAGTLRCVVATSSLELGIDMGAVDQIIQIDPPPSVSSGLQRMGRSGHQVGGVSRAIIYPTHRSKLIPTAAIVKGMIDGEIEPLSLVSNPLDVLAQQTIATASAGVLDVEEWFDTVRKAANYANLPRSAYIATLDLVSGKYPSSEFANLRARVNWDRVAGTLDARPGAKRLAVTAGGTIPDRGLYRVVVVGDDGGSSRVGELDEEMVYETRIGEVFALGTTSWRVRTIGKDNVEVVPTFGLPAKIPFWRGDTPSRPVQLGEAIGRITAQILAGMKAGKSKSPAPRQPGSQDLGLQDLGFDAFAIDNTLEFLNEQLEQAGIVPTADDLLVEITKDDVGDWRLILESPYGLEVHGPWALAINVRIREIYGADAQAVPSNDGIIVRVADTTDEPPGAEVFKFDPEEIIRAVTQEVEGSALFASRFRECAQRSLVLGVSKPGTRSPLWQQRQRAARLLEVALRYPDFPVILETLRECLQDVYDTAALQQLMVHLRSRRIRISEVKTESPGPYARSLLFGYVGEFLYEGDTPAGERRLAALSVDPQVLQELMGEVEFKELLESEAIAQVQAELQHTAEGWRLSGEEGVVDLLRILGPLSRDQLLERLNDERDDALTFIDAAITHRRAFETRLGGTGLIVAAEDAGLLVGACGAAVPPGIPLAFLEIPPNPVRELLVRLSATNGPFTAEDVAVRYAISVDTVRFALERMRSEGLVLTGNFTPEDAFGQREATEAEGTESASVEYISSGVLSRLRGLSLAMLRGSVEPVNGSTYARFLIQWQHADRHLYGRDGVLSVIDQLAGLPLPASTWETLVLPARIADYETQFLDQLVASGEVTWSGSESLSRRDGWVCLHFSDTAELTMIPQPGPIQLSPLQSAIVGVLRSRGALFVSALVPELADLGFHPGAQELSDAMWSLVWNSMVTSDSIAALRAKVSGRAGAQKTAPTRPRARSLRASSFSGLRPPKRGHSTLTEPTLAGRWSLLTATAASEAGGASASQSDGQAAVALDDAQATTWLALLLERYGVVTSRAVKSEGFPGGFAQAYRMLSEFERTGACRRGYFVAGQGGAQFAATPTIDELRSIEQRENGPELSSYAGSGRRVDAGGLVTLSATDPANAYGSVLPWPRASAEGAHEPKRNPGALVVLDRGEVAFYLERGGKTALTFSEHLNDEDAAVERRAVAGSLVNACRAGGLETFTLQTIDATPAGQSLWAESLRAAGFENVPRGLRLRRRVN